MAREIVLTAREREDELFELAMNMGRAEGYHRGYADAIASKAEDWLAYNEQRIKDRYHEWLQRYGFFDG